ncbi:MAG TPA: 1-(5-phosphoribosyl)-5-[(5-phosphoribosylamino)methylideneamino]imidazole-4-carboxamide isomerase [Dehalococcoidia bacterium]|nr:1-(5-phosphoribosyl)-5-[(5-phosphoribosylamino)methylideneamino]imidazole-4-carboxamide isomerase [Dehalococcoidia bacterium]
MEIIPAIDIRGGRCVQLKQGDYDRQTTYGEDPVAMARYWRDEGATRLHVVDLDGAKAGTTEQREIILHVVAELGADLPVQVGGGVRNLRDVKAYIEGGVQRVILGSAAIKDQETVVKACSQYPGQIIVALDARDGKVTAEAWHETSDVDAIDLAEELEAAGAPRFLYTDVGRDGMLEGPNLEVLRALVQRVSVPVIASGGIGRLEDIAAAEEAGAEGCIVGTALYEGLFTLREAMASSTIGR